MRQIARFYTLFWIIYFPTCIAFNDFHYFTYVDEVMTLLLLWYTLKNRGSRSINKRPIKEFYIFWCIILFYFFYSLLWGENVLGGILLDLIQEIRPYSVIYCTWLLNPQFSNKQKRWIRNAIVASMFAWLLTHPLSSDSESPVLGQLAICSGMVWYLFSKPTPWNKHIALMLVLMGMLAPKFKFLGEVVAFVGMLYYVKKKISFNNPKIIWTIVLFAVVTLYIAWERVDAYYISGFTSEVRLARPETYKTSLIILMDYFPFGPGMGTFACNGAWKYYSPLYYKYDLNTVWGLDPGGGFICDAYYPTLAQFGIVGVLLFGIFWKRRLQMINAIRDMRYYRVAWMAFFCLAFEQTADSSILSGKGMGYCFLFALCLNANRNQAMWDALKTSYESDNDGENHDDDESIG